MLGLCRQFHCLPSRLLEEDTYLLRLLQIEALGTPEEDREAVMGG